MGVTVSVALVIYLLWFIVPALRTAFTTELTAVNQTSPVMAAVLPAANGWFTILPVIIIMVGGYVAYLYATRSDAFDTGGM